MFYMSKLFQYLAVISQKNYNSFYNDLWYLCFNRFHRYCSISTLNSFHIEKKLSEGM